MLTDVRLAGTSAWLVAAAFMLSGCVHNIQGQPNYDPSGKATAQGDYSNCLAPPPPVAPTNQATCIRAYVFERMDQIDQAYDGFKGELFYGSSLGDLSADLAVTGLGLAGSLVPSATTKATLAAISAGLTGAKTSVDQDILLSNSLVTLIAKMDADRAQQKVAILNKLASPTTNYGSIYEANVDLQAYAEAGKLHNSILSVGQTAGNTLSTCQQAETALVTSAKAGVTPPPGTPTSC